MLSRTADNLYWLGRFVERMDYLARLLEVAWRMSVISPPQRLSEWHSALIAAGVDEHFATLYAKPDAEAVTTYLARDARNPSNILACLNQARHNGRAVRASLSVDAWEALNSTWLEAQGLAEESFASANVGETLDWIKARALLFNGAFHNTMLRSEAFHFLHLGTFIERIDNTARILDVKYHILLPGYEQVGGAVDFYQWTSILRAVSARRAYHVLYKERVTPWNVAELLILRPEMPRSLRFCFGQVMATLDELAVLHGGRTGECHRLAGELNARFRYGRIDAIFQSGLHEFLEESIDRTAILGNEISRLYMS